MKNYSADIKRLDEYGKGLRFFLSNFCSLGFFSISVFRFFSFLRRHHIPNLLIRFPIEKIVEIVSGISIPANCSIGPGLRIHHFGGIVFHDSVKIGKNATIYHGVTLGVKRDDETQGPIIGNNIYIGAGAKVLGAIKIGNNVTIGANAVVLTHVPDNCLAVGVPARIINKSSNNFSAEKVIWKKQPNT